MKSKPFKTIDEQLELLQSRGVQFTDVNKANLYLLNNNYYNVINCYGKFFIDHDDEYIEGTNFDEITQVHYFDKELKSELFKVIIEAEKHLKSIIAYRFSEEYKSNDYAYLVATNYNSDDMLSIQNRIAKDLSVFLAENLELKKCLLQPKQLISYLNNIVELRNIVAHNNRVLGFNCRQNTIYNNELHSKYGIDKNSP